jgi:aspartate/methionine/tyrosine aminotransferase
MNKFSKISENLIGQKMFQILAQAKELERQGKDVIHFEIGDPDYKTPQNIKDAGCKAIQDDHTHYTISQGLEEFRYEASKKISISRNFLPSVEQILVTPGANIQIYLTLLAVADPGDEIIITDPCFVSYVSIINLCNLVPIKVTLREENDFRLSPDDLKNAITKKTKLIIINSPNNPTGSVIKKDEMKSIYEIAEKNDIYILSDEVYSRMVFEKGEFLSPSSFDRCNERVIVAHSFSKSHAMTGWRIGAVMGPKELIRRMTLILETITSCVSPFIQIAAIEALTGPHPEVDKMINTLMHSRNTLVSGLNSIEGISCLSPGGSFYAFPNVSGLKMNGLEFSDYLLKESFIATCPGAHFGDAGKNYVRFCFATPEIKIREAIDRMRLLFN